jgi:hypothetical protein
MGTIRTVTPPDSLGNHLTELKHKLLMEAKTRTILRPTIRRTTLHTLMRSTPQSSAASTSRSLPLLTTAKRITITPLIKSTPTMRDHMPLNSGSTKTKSRPKTHSALLLPARISTINPRIMGITDRKVLSNSMSFNNTSPPHSPPLAGTGSPLPKRDSDWVFLDMQHKQRSRRHDEHTEMPCSRPIAMGLLLSDSQLRRH